MAAPADKGSRPLGPGLSESAVHPVLISSEGLRRHARAASVFFPFHFPVSTRQRLSCQRSHTHREGGEERQACGRIHRAAPDAYLSTGGPRMEGLMWRKGAGKHDEDGSPRIKRSSAHEDEEAHFATPQGCFGHGAMFNVSVVQGCRFALFVFFLLCCCCYMPPRFRFPTQGAALLRRDPDDRACRGHRRGAQDAAGRGS